MSVYERCKCHEARKSAALIRKSGITSNQLLSDINPAEWQMQMMILAKAYIDNPTWLYFGGQVGSGKTMIATAIVNEMLKKVIPCRYMLWRDEIVKLKASVNYFDDYQDLILPLKMVEVLYIDDLFKTEQGKPPTQADVNLAFEIINSRYNNPTLKTILTSERSIEDILAIDEAVGSRIYERCKKYNYFVKKDSAKNYRLRG